MCVCMLACPYIELAESAWVEEELEGGPNAAQEGVGVDHQDALRHLSEGRRGDRRGQGGRGTGGTSDYEHKSSRTVGMEGCSVFLRRSTLC